MEPNLPGNAGQYLSVLNCASEYGLSLDTCGRECVWSMLSVASRPATVFEVIGVPRSAWRPAGAIPPLALTACWMNSLARVPFSVGHISQPVTLREKMSMMTYKRYQVPRAGPFSLVISQDHTWFGPSAISSGFFFAGWVAWAR